MSATDETGWTLWAEPTRGRSCGKCQACCFVVPVELADEHKPAHQRCKHQCSRGCAIYPTRPAPCAWWSCKWLIDPDTADLKRPDIGGYIIDPQPDTILMDGKPVRTMQVWIDPKRRHVYRDSKLMAYIARVAERFRIPTIVRFSQTDAVMLFAPCLTGDGTWHERADKPISHEAMAEKLDAIGVRRFGP
jgi:hypothetical protein